MNIPLTESDKISQAWLKTAYYISLGSASLLGGMLVAIVLMLYSTVTDIIHIIGVGNSDHPLIDEDDK